MDKVDGRRKLKNGGPGGVVRVYKGTWDKLQAYCRATGERVTEVVEQAVKAWLGERE